MHDTIKSKIIIGMLIVAVIAIVGVMVVQSSSNTTSRNNTAFAATIYKSPSCGCCEKYAAYLPREEYDVEIQGIQDMSMIKEKYDIPFELESCHTTMEVDGYVVEGHVPQEAVQKMLTEKPDIAGIGMAGMPSGSSGMPGPKNSDFVIYEITHDGEKGDVFMTI